LRERRGSVRANDRSCVFYLSVVLLKGRDGDEACIPEVVGAVLIANEYEGNLRVVLGGEDTGSGGRVVLVGVGAEGLVQLLDQVGVLAVERVALSVGSLLLNQVEIESGVGCAVIVAVVS
jgi:hypothetical protein